MVNYYQGYRHKGQPPYVAVGLHFSVILLPADA
jgi:hypothetical protein